MDRAILQHLPGVRRTVAVSVGMGLLATAVLVAQMALLAQIVADVFIAHNDSHSPTLPLLLLALLSLLHATLLGLRETLGQTGASSNTRALRARFVAHLLALGPAYLRGRRSGELVSTAGEGIDRLDPYIARYLPQCVLCILIPLLVGLAIATQDRISAVILLATAPVLPLLMVLVGTYAAAQIRGQWTALTRMSAHFLDMLQGMTTLKSFGRGAAARESVARVSTAYRDRTLGTLRYAFLSGLVLEFITAGAIALVAVTLGIRLLAGDIGFQRAFFVLLLTPEFYRPLRELGQHRHAAMEAQAPAEQVVAVLGTGTGQSQPETPARQAPASRPRNAARPARRGLQHALAHDNAHGLPSSSGSSPYLSVSVVSVPPCSPHSGAPARPTTITDDALRLAAPLRITCRHVCFAYPGTTQRVLEDIDLVLPPGARTALVGPSGAGKTTLLHLMLRFIEPTAGQIEVNGIPIHSLPPESWRAHIAYVPQRPHLFAGSLADNIRLGRPDAPQVEVAWAAAQAGADRFIERLPHGYSTHIGERGAGLSGGEAQRIAIARAFLRDAPVLILDEPTSSLDPETESAIRTALERLMHRRTVLVVAHRLNTVYTADQIVVLHGGRVVESGQHTELTANDGLYARLVGAGGQVVLA